MKIIYHKSGKSEISNPNVQEWSFFLFWKDKLKRKII